MSAGEQPPAAHAECTHDAGETPAPPDLGEAPHPGDAGQPPKPDHERGNGDPSPGSGDLFALWSLPGRQRTALPRRSKGAHSSPPASRVKAARDRLLPLFDAPARPDQAIAEPEPSGAQ